MQRIILIGFMGSGKTTLGKRLAGFLKIPFWDSDALIEQKTNMTINEIFASQGEEAFREMESNVIGDLFELNEFVLAVGGGLPAIPGMMERLNELGTTVFLNVSKEELFRRLSTNRSKRPLLKDKSEFELRDHINRLCELRENIYLKAKVCIQKDALKVEELMDKIILHQRN